MCGECIWPIDIENVFRKKGILMQPIPPSPVVIPIEYTFPEAPVYENPQEKKEKSDR